MKKEKEATHIVTCCDVCGEECEGTEPCYICGRDLCFKHRIYGNCTIEGIRWNQVYCSICWEAGKDIRRLIEIVEKEAATKKEHLEKMWKEKAMQVVCES